MALTQRTSQVASLDTTELLDGDVRTLKARSMYSEPQKVGTRTEVDWRGDFLYFTLGVEGDELSGF